MATNLTRAEQETHITRAADQDHWRIFTEDPVMIRRLRRLFGEPARRTDSGGGTWDVPIRAVLVRKGEKRSLSPRQLEAVAKMRAKRPEPEP